MNRYFNQKAILGRVDIEFHVSDFTPPWRPREPETILMVHGLCRNMDFWRSWVPALATGYRVIRMNVRGCGASGVDADAYTTGVLAQDAIRLLDALGLEQVHWIGESTGGLVGLRAALTWPARVQSITLVETPLNSLQQTDADRAGVASRLSLMHKRKLEIEEYWRATLADSLDVENASMDIQEWYVREMSKVDAFVATGQLNLTLESDLLAGAGELRLPMLNLLADPGHLVRKHQVGEIVRMMPRMKVVVFEGVGHGIAVLRPQQCVSEVIAFLAGQPLGER